MKYIFISARTGSTRLANKAIIDICGKPSIQYLVDNLKKSKCAEDIVLCTTNRKEDDILCDIAFSSGIKCFRGSSDDKLERWRGACEKFSVDFFVSVDGDDLFFDHGLADHVFKQYEKKRCDFIDGHGLYNDVYGITRSSLDTVCGLKGTNKTEYIRPHFTEATNFHVERIEKFPDKYLKNDIRMTLDYPEDLDFFKSVIMGVGPKDLTFDKVLSFINNNPDIKLINSSLEEKWKENQRILYNVKPEKI